MAGRAKGLEVTRAKLVHRFCQWPGGKLWRTEGLGKQSSQLKTRTAAHRRLLFESRGYGQEQDRLPQAFLRACFTKSSKVIVFPDFFRTASTLFSAAAFGRPSVSRADNASLRKILFEPEGEAVAVSPQPSRLSLSLRSMITRWAVFPPIPLIDCNAAVFS